MKRQPVLTALLVAVTVMLGAAALDAIAILAGPLWPWLAWMKP